MCIGVPMQVVEGDEVSALCQRYGETARVTMWLVGAQDPGTWVLTHLGSAMRVLEADEARLIDEALTGLAEAVAGSDFEKRFADLIDREPQLPEHLR